MSRYINKDTPFFDNTTGEVLPFGIVYFGEPNTDPIDPLNAKAPYENRQLTTPADATQTLTIGGKLQQRLYLDGAYAITVTDADGNVIDTDPYYVGESSDQIVNDSTVTGATISDALDALQTQITALQSSAVSLDTVFRVGGLYLTTVNEHPGSYAGFGTWTAEGQGRVLIGAGSGTDANGLVQAFTAGDTGGEYTHTLTAAKIPAHKHFMFGGTVFSASTIGGDVTVARSQNSSGSNQDYVLSPIDGTPENGTTSNTGSGEAHNNIQPYLTVYFWRRTA